MKNKNTIRNVRCHHIMISIVILFFLMFQTLPTMAGVDYDSSINYYQSAAYQSIDSDGSAETQISYQSFSGPVGSGWTVGSTESFGLTSGYANAGDFSMGVSSQVISGASNTHLSDARISTSITNSLTILPGSSGLNYGDTTNLIIKLSLDGTMHAEAASWPKKGWSHAEMSAGLSVKDGAIEIDTGEVRYVPTQAFFGASCELEAYDVYMPYWGRSYSSSWEESWQMGSNISDTVSHSYSDEINGNAESFHYQSEYSFDTGELTLVFQAIVGHTLDFSADLYTYIDANNDAQTWAEFGNTFSLDVTSEVPGVNLNWQLIPEPATISMLMIGAALLRRRAK